MRTLKYFVVFAAFWIFFGSMCLAETSPKILLILDPGHGGRDHGGAAGAGFRTKGRYVPEDACNYDVASRVARLAREKGWQTVFTIIPEDPADSSLACEPYDALPPRREMRYNLPGRSQRVDYQPSSRMERRQGVRKRLEAARIAARTDRDAVVIYISIHFDYVEKCAGRRRCQPVPDPDVSGARVYTTRALAKHPFVHILARELEEAGLGTEASGTPKPTVDASHKFICLREGAIVPRVLVEFGNFNNWRDRAFMLDENGRDTYAKIIVGAVEGYASNLSSPNEADPAQQNASETGVSQSPHKTGDLKKPSQKGEEVLMAAVIELIAPDRPCPLRTIGPDPCSQNGKMEDQYKKPNIPVRDFLKNLARRVGLYVVDIPSQALEYFPGEPSELAA